MSRLGRIWVGTLCLGFLFQGIGRAENDRDVRMTQYLARIEKYLEKGLYGNAVHERQELAQFAEASGRFDVAARQYELLLAARPKRSDRVKYFTKLGKMHMAMNEYDKAIAHFEDALHDSPKDWDANLARARAFAAADINQRAIESYRKCIALRPQEPAPYQEIASVYQEQGFVGKALQYYEMALARDAQPTIYLQMADCYVHQQNLPKAIEILSKAKTELPQAEYDVRLGEIYLKRGEDKQAVQSWEDALKVDSKRDDVRLRLSMLYHMNGRPQDSDRLFRDLTQTYPESALVYHLKALQLLERGQRDAALKAALHVQQLAPTELVSHYNDLLILEIKDHS